MQWCHCPAQNLPVFSVTLRINYTSLPWPGPQSLGQVVPQTSSPITLPGWLPCLAIWFLLVSSKCFMCTWSWACALSLPELSFHACITQLFSPLKCPLIRKVFSLSLYVFSGTHTAMYFRIHCLSPLQI